jgi:hypothetical protein
MGTKQTSIFADEERIRENITTLYMGVCNQEVRPSNLQEERVVGLQGDITKAAAKNEALTKLFSEKVKVVEEKLPKSKVVAGRND